MMEPTLGITPILAVVNLTVWTYAIYLTISVALTVWVAKTLHRNGRIFLVRAFHADEHLADSVNHLLVVGFYLINIGWITLALKYGVNVGDLAGVFEAVSTKVGFVLVLLGVMHFLNLYVFNRMRHRAALETAPPPVAPDGELAFDP
ncbi:MAG: hypothetical protein AAGJ38_07445 [Planctomycetota bacterium]